MDNNAVRIEVLNLLHQCWEKAPVNFVSKGWLLEQIPVDENTLSRNVLYLEDKGMVECVKSLGSLFDGAMLTARGIDFVEGNTPFNPDAIKVRIEKANLDDTTKAELFEAVKEITASLDNVNEKARIFDKLGEHARLLVAEVIAAVARGFLFGQ
jgi:hypothetical protein